MNNVKTKPGKITAYGIVRDRNGKPRFDNINNIPAQIWDMLTDDEKQEIEIGRYTSRNDS
jgi:hypothetical protein